MRKISYQINNLLLKVILTIIYFPLLGLGFLLYKLFKPSSGLENTFWIKPEEKTRLSSRPDSSY